MLLLPFPLPPASRKSYLDGFIEKCWISRGTNEEQKCKSKAPLLPLMTKPPLDKAKKMMDEIELQVRSQGKKRRRTGDGQLLVVLRLLLQRTEVRKCRKMK